MIFRLTEKHFIYASILAVLLFLQASRGDCAVYTQYTDTRQNGSDKVEIQIEEDIREARISPPILAPIPSRKDVTPHKADEVPPSRDLLEIISRVKNQTIPDTEPRIRDKKEKEISKESLEIIRAGKKQAVTAENIKPSAALESVLKAYRNGSLEYTHRTLNPEDAHEHLFYHQPYSEVDLQSIFDMTVLISGKDIFLSLGLTPLEQDRKTEEENRSSRIKDLQQTIAAIKVSDARKAAEQKLGGQELQKDSTNERALIKPRKLMVKQIMDFFGIRRRDDAGRKYEEMATAFRLYKQWVDRWERMDKYVKKQKVQRIQLNRYRRSGKGFIDTTDTNFPAVQTGKQLQINPYANEKIYLPNK
ncbi:hypothetical protein [Maridesulfovibrio sp. FT414]|uniref:hypothetical protein n=1 Tax=Maridesulfovibrio sp. FT414 TaxID=2979469 RepID=UPI003D801D8A